MEFLERSNEKLLLVLDDLWLDESKDRELFDQLLIPFNEVENRRSSIFITTRNEQTTSIIGVGAENSLPLAELSSKDCWSIVKHYAFGDAEKVITNSELAQIGNQIVDKLRKSPLAAQMIGVQLGRKVDVNEWRIILRGDILKDTMKTLLWSYNRLPAHLQQCFAFCSLFPKGWHFESDKLVKYWVANGFVEVPNRSELTLEDQGNRYFNDLLVLSFFIPLENIGSEYVIHDLMHDLAEDVSRGHCYRVEGDEHRHIPETVIHLSIGTKKLVTHFPAIANLMNLRTFIVIMESSSYNIPEKPIIIFNEKWRKVRVLDVAGAIILGHDGPLPLKGQENTIDKLKHLQLLAVRGLNKLSESLGRLHHLKYLEIEDCPKLTGIPFLPRALRVLTIRSCDSLMQVPSLPYSLYDLCITNCPNLMMELSPFPPLLKKLELWNCRGTKTLISEMTSSSSSLESLDLDNCSTPDVMLLTCLTSVTEITVGYCESLRSFVLGDNMKALLSLEITGCKNLRSLEGIGSLPSLKWLSIEYCPMLVTSLEPVVYHACCEEVTITGCANLSLGRRPAGEVHRGSNIKCLRMDDLPLLEDMSQHLISLSELAIEDFKDFPSLPVNILNNLPPLKRLELSSCRESESLPEVKIPCSGEMESYVNNLYLPSTSQISNHDYLQLKWVVELESLSSLDKLIIEDCPKLESLPNMTNLSSLKELSISNCPKLLTSLSNTLTDTP